MRYLLPLILILTFSNADYLATSHDNRCVYDLQPNQGNSGWCYTYSDNNNSRCNRRDKRSYFIGGYVYSSDDDTCLLKNDLKISGLTQREWDYLLAILAHVMGFTMLFLINFLAVLTARK